MEIAIKTILRQIITQCAGTHDIIKKLASCDPCGRKIGLKTVVFLLRLSIQCSYILYNQSIINIQILPYLAGFPDILN